MLLKEPLSLTNLTHELRLGAAVVFVDIEEVVNGLAIFLVKFCAESRQHLFELVDAHCARPIDIAASEELIWRDASVLEDLE